MTTELYSTFADCERLMRPENVSRREADATPHLSSSRNDGVIRVTRGQSSLPSLAQATQGQKPISPPMPRFPIDMSVTTNSIPFQTLSVGSDNAATLPMSIEAVPSVRRPGISSPPRTGIQQHIASTTSTNNRSLTSRGKGKYTCPYGRSCTKGGVQRDGTPVIFERNSAYR